MFKTDAQQTLESIRHWSLKLGVKMQTELASKMFRYL